jgi:DNA-binding transcriptional LysR family regulator
MTKSSLKLDASAIFARNIDWNLFKIFHEIVRQGGITAAARSLNKQQPSVSAALQRLESHVGASLCVRTNRGIKLTVYGDQLFAACQGMYESVQEMPRSASAVRGDISGVVELRVISNLYLQPKLTKIIDDFHVQYPRIEIKLDVGPWRDVLQSLKAGDVELAIGFDDDPGSDRLHVLIAEQPQQLYCGPKHRFFGEAAVAPSMLEDDPFVVTEDEPMPYVRCRDRFGLGREIQGFADSLHERMWLIQMGMGIGFLPTPIVEASHFAQALWPLLPKDDAPVCNIYLMANANAIRSAPSQLFLDVALTHLQSDG